MSLVSNAPGLNWIFHGREKRSPNGSWFSAEVPGKPASKPMKPMKILYRLLCLQLAGGFLFCPALQATPQSAQDSGRVSSGLQVLYDFALSAGPVV